MRIRIGKKRNRNNAWVPGFRFWAEDEFARLDTPLVGILVRLESGIPIVRFEYLRISNRNQGDVYFKKAKEFSFLNWKIFTKSIDMDIFNPRNPKPSPLEWICNGAIYTLDAHGSPRLTGRMDMH